MTRLVDHFVVPWLSLVADWSVRWGVVLVVLAAWLALRPPRRAATRYLLCLAALTAGVLVPVAPRWGNVAVTWNVPGAQVAGEVVEAAPPSARPDGATAEPTLSSEATETQTVRSRLIVRSETVLPTSAPLGNWRLAALALAVAWATIVLVLLIRLAGNRTNFSKSAAKRSGCRVSWGWRRTRRSCRPSSSAACGRSSSSRATGAAGPSRIAAPACCTSWHTWRGMTTGPSWRRNSSAPPSSFIRWCAGC
jgi:hypothetical protein